MDTEVFSFMTLWPTRIKTSKNNLSTVELLDPNDNITINELTAYQSTEEGGYPAWHFKHRHFKDRSLIRWPGSRP